jgi:hypothetical protein
MVTATKTHPHSTEKASLLKKAILGNAVFSFLSGLFLTLTAGPAAAFLGVSSAVIQPIGVVLLLYAPILFWLANQAPINKTLAWIVIELDILWVIGSAVLIFSSLMPLTIAGKWAIAFVADIVAVFAIVQYLGVRRMK